MRTLTRRLMAVALSLVSIPGFFIATAPTAEAATPCFKQVFTYDLTTKSCVRYVQTMLNSVYAWEYAHGGRLGGQRVLEVDGKYGEKTQAAVRRLQQSGYGYTWSGTFVEFTVTGNTNKHVWAYLCYHQEGTSTATKAGCVESELYFEAVGLSETKHD